MCVTSLCIRWCGDVCMQCVLLFYVVVANDSGAEGAKALAASLEKNTSLTTLNLESKRRGQGSVQGCKCAGCLPCVCEHVCYRIWVNSDYARMSVVLCAFGPVGGACTIDRCAYVYTS